MGVICAALALTALWAAPFDPGAVRGALGHDEARAGALQTLANLGLTELQVARRAHLGAAVVVVAADVTLGHVDRVLAVRAAAALGGGPEVVDALVGLASGDGTPEAVALAREAARALSQRGEGGALVDAMRHADPEVRALAAGAGAGGPSTQCATLMGDPWPMVRIAAARGLIGYPEDTACLAPALAPGPMRVRVAAARAAARAPVAALRDPLRQLAADIAAPLDARADALVALAGLGDLDPARAVLTTHLAKGGIVPLARGAVHAFARAGDTARLRAALGSQDPSIQLAAARALAEVGDTDSVPALRALLPDLDPHTRAALREVLQRMAPEDLEDPARSDPE